MNRTCPAWSAGLALVLGAWPAVAHGTSRSPGAPSRSIWTAPTYQLLLSDAFEPSSRHGLGANLSYEFAISPRFDLGLGLAYRLYPGETATHQLGYGAILKHFFSPDWATAEGVFPFLDYGLLLQQSFIDGRKGSATSHDSRLGAGMVFRTAALSLFASVAGHYSRLDQFGVESTWIPYLEGQLGWVFAY